MEIKTKTKLTNGLKVTGLVIFLAVLSGCHALPVHHGYSQGHRSSGYNTNASHHSRHSYSLDY